MTTTELRTLALALQNRIADSYTALLPAYTKIAQWTLNGADDALPTVAELKAVYNAFNSFEKPDYRLVEEVRALKVTTDEAVALVDEIAPFPHTHLKADVTDFPTVMPPDAHTHLKTDVTDFPTVMPPDAHTHLKADVTDFPTVMPPDAHTHLKTDVTDFPTVMPPESHTHLKADVTDFPATFPPAAHSHAVTAYMRYAGNGATSRVLTLSAAIMPTTIFIMRDDVGLNLYWATPLYSAMLNLTTWLPDSISVTTGSITLTTVKGNSSGYAYTLLAWGNAS